MWLFLLFASAAFGAECETSTCAVCKTNSSCDWYGFDCLSKTSTTVTSLNLDATATCPTCQAGSCADCQNQAGCSWYSNAVLGGKCDVNSSAPAGYDLVPTCPTCYLNTTCESCTSGANSSCNWYVLPGGVGGKCREASPSFAYTKVPANSCATGNPCAGVTTCSSCQAVNDSSTNCSWYTSKSPTFYNSKCDESQASFVDSGLYTQVSGTCPKCAGISCSTCKAESGCKWVAIQGLTGIAFGQCLEASAPSSKKEIATCPATCEVHSCLGCTGIGACRWYAGNSHIDDSCDLSTDSYQHPFQSALNQTSQCGACMADRCYECNNLPGCGWYSNKIAGHFIAPAGCYPTNAFPSGRSLVANSDEHCEGRPSSSASVVASFGLLFVLALLA